MFNPLKHVFDFFLNFMTCLPDPAISFLSLALCLFLVCSVLRWFL